jgi:hypothetical protein
MTDLLRNIHMDEFKTNIKIIVDDIIYSMDKNKQYIVVDDNYDSDNDSDREDLAYEGTVYWDDLISQKLSLYDSIKNIEIGEYRGISRRMELNITLFDYLVETHEFWKNDPETNTEFREIIYNKLKEYLNGKRQPRINIGNGIKKRVKIYGTHRDYMFYEHDFPAYKYIKLLKLRCNFEECTEKLCWDISTSDKNLICKSHNRAIKIDQLQRSYVKGILPLHNDVSNIVLDYLPMYKMDNSTSTDELCAIS